MEKFSRTTAAIVLASLTASLALPSHAEQQATASGSVVHPPAANAGASSTTTNTGVTNSPAQPATNAAVTPATNASPTPATNASQTPATNASPTPAATPTAGATSEDTGKVIWKPGQALSVDANTEDIIPTYDVALAEKQKAAYPDSAEASFILAVALTRTSRVEEALKEVQHARRLAEAKGGPVYFDKMIAAYEKMLTAYPDDNRVRYGLAWAYYMKAYLLAQQSRRVVRWKQANPELAAQLEAQKNPPAAATTSGVNKEVVKALTGSPAAAAATLATLATGGMTGKRGSLDNLPHIPGALEKVDPADVPQIRNYFERALGKIDEILKREPNDVWTIVYGAHLRAEYTGNLDDAMKTWKSVASKYPNNPAPYFFLGEGYLKQGNLKESINNVSRAIALRALGN